MTDIFIDVPMTRGRVLTHLADGSDTDVFVDFPAGGPITYQLNASGSSDNHGGTFIYPVLYDGHDATGTDFIPATPDGYEFVGMSPYCKAHIAGGTQATITDDTSGWGYNPAPTKSPYLVTLAAHPFTFSVLPAGTDPVDPIVAAVTIDLAHEQFQSGLYIEKWYAPGTIPPPYTTEPVHIVLSTYGWRFTFTPLPDPPPPPATVLVRPDFFFSDYVLDPEKPHRVEITFDPDSVHDLGGRGFWLTGVRNHFETDDFDLIGHGPGFANLYDGGGNLLDHATIVIGPGVGGWDDPATGVAAGYNRIWFETDVAGAVSEVAVTKICTAPPPPPPPPPPEVKPPPEPAHPEVPAKPSGPPPAAWAADVRISMPMPPNGKPQVNVGGGFAFSNSGLVHDITEAVYKQLTTPTFAPTEYGQEVVYEDEDLTTEPTDLKVF